ncbi:hypothetical protein BLNAU_14371 [Blattamonas nauphoetae]|uniref:C2H2-type domain-containing protein n=1 Tax=Blattamonas nauphoetae TaxID=2049346 RepID=A0ABQ9XHN2_9EUKA|nr:hypothetical protein BLNAU_14371 [Blattamonas nauphoetae]
MFFFHYIVEGIAVVRLPNTNDTYYCEVVRRKEEKPGPERRYAQFVGWDVRGKGRNAKKRLVCLNIIGDRACGKTFENSTHQFRQHQCFHSSSTKYMVLWQQRQNRAAKKIGGVIVLRSKQRIPEINGSHQGQILAEIKENRNRRFENLLEPLDKPEFNLKVNGLNSIYQMNFSRPVWTLMTSKEALPHLTLKKNGICPGILKENRRIKYKQTFTGGSCIGTVLDLMVKATTNSKVEESFASCARHIRNTYHLQTDTHTQSIQMLT